MRVLKISVAALWGGALLLAGCSEKPDNAIVDPPQVKVERDQRQD